MNKLVKEQFEFKEPGKSINIYEEGLYVLEINNSQIETCGKFVNNFYKIKSKREKIEITRNALTMMKGAVFAVGAREYQNIEWKEHAASSLREVFHEWTNGDLAGDFNKYYIDNTRLTNEQKLLLKTLRQQYQFFSGIAHHSHTKILHSMQALKGDVNLKYDNCIDDNLFIMEIKKFFKNIITLLSFVEKNL